VHLTDSLSNPAEAVARLVVALGERGGHGNVQVTGGVPEAIIAQTGAVDPASVRLQVRENRKLSPAEVAELVDTYQAGASQRELTRRFGLHEQTVRAHLRRQGVTLRLQRVLTDTQEAEAVRLYVEEVWSLAELAARFEVGQTAIRSVLMRRGVARRAQVRRV
jgi:transposase-like protein